jgi:hypothetical protein
MIRSVSGAVDVLAQATAFPTFRFRHHRPPVRASHINNHQRHHRNPPKLPELTPVITSFTAGRTAGKKRRCELELLRGGEGDIRLLLSPAICSPA